MSGKISYLMAGIVVTAMCPLAAAGAQLTFTENFESNKISTSKWAYSGNKARTTNSKIRKGNYSAIVSLDRKKDAVPFRTEIRKRGFFSYNKENWIAVSVYIPNDWQSDTAPITFMQWHSVPDKKLGEGYRNAPIAFRIHKDSWQLALRWDDEKVTTRSTYDGRMSKSLGKLQKGQWTDWVIRLKLSYSKNGVLEVWKNGAKVFTRNGPNTFNDSIAPFFKIGQYIPVWKPNYPWKFAVKSSKPQSHILYIDEIKMATGSDGMKMVRP